MTRISLYAKGLPRQLRGPKLNGCEAAWQSARKGDDDEAGDEESSGDSSHRSGMKSDGR